MLKEDSGYGTAVVDTFKIVNQNSLSEFYIKFINKGPGSPGILEICTDCGSTVAQWDLSKEIKSNRSDSLFIKYDTQNTGAYNKKVMVELNPSNRDLL